MQINIMSSIRVWYLTRHAFFWVQSPKALIRSSGRAIMEPWRSLSHPTENYMGVGFKESALDKVFFGLLVTSVTV